MNDSIFWMLLGLVLSLPVGMMGSWLLPKWQNWYATTSKRRARKRLLKLHIRFYLLWTMKKNIRILIVCVAQILGQLIVLAGCYTLLIGGYIVAMSKLTGESVSFTFYVARIMLAFSMFGIVVFPIPIFILLRRLEELRNDIINPDAGRKKFQEFRRKLRMVIGKPDIVIRPYLPRRTVKDA